MKYEENVEANGTRWSKPYVSTVNVSSFHDLRESFRYGLIIFDSDAYNFENIVEEFCDRIYRKNLCTNENVQKIANILLSEKHHLFQKKKTLMRSLADIRQHSSNNFLKLLSGSTSKCFD